MANNAPLPVARARVSIGGITGTYDQSTLAADTYTQIGGIRNIPGFGDTYDDITVQEVTDGRTRHATGTANGATMAIVASRRSTDTGQIAINAASGTGASYNMKIELPSGALDSSDAIIYDTYYLSVLVNGKPTGLGGPNDTQTITWHCQPQEAPIEVLG